MAYSAPSRAVPAPSWVSRPATTADQAADLLPHRSDDACDSWNRWAEDIALLSRIGLNAYRLSIEWARIEPQPGEFDQAALDTYRRQLEGLKEAGIEPLITLHHFTS